MRFTFRITARARAEAIRIVNARAIYRSIRNGQSSDWPAIWAAIPARRRDDRIYIPVNRELRRTRSHA